MKMGLFYFLASLLKNRDNKKDATIGETTIYDYDVLEEKSRLWYNIDYGFAGLFKEYKSRHKH